MLDGAASSAGEHTLREDSAHNQQPMTHNIIRHNGKTTHNNPTHSRRGHEHVGHLRHVGGLVVTPATVGTSTVTPRLHRHHHGQQQQQQHQQQTRDSLAVSLLRYAMNNMQSRSVCNWTYVNNQDVNRIPVDLPEAVCWSNTLRDSANVCQPVMYYVPVKRQITYQSGDVVWSDVIEAIDVGCVLARPVNQSRGPTRS